MPLEAVQSADGQPTHRSVPLDGADLIWSERERQKSQKGYDAAHDDQHVNGELVKAAVCYASPIYPGSVFFPWPNGGADKRGRGFYDYAPISLGYAQQRIPFLVKAGALIAAEIDRCQRTLDAAKAQETALLAERKAHTEKMLAEAQRLQEQEAASAWWTPTIRELLMRLLGIPHYQLHSSTLVRLTGAKSCAFMEANDRLRPFKPGTLFVYCKSGEVVGFGCSGSMIYVGEILPERNA